MKSISRRNFIKGAAAAMALGRFGLPTFAAELTPPPDSRLIQNVPSVVYPPLLDHKVQAPEYGCIVGLRKPYYQRSDPVVKEWRGLTENVSSLDELATALNDPKFDQTLQTFVGEEVEYYRNAFGRPPGIFALVDYTKLFLNFPSNQVAAISKKGVIPYINFVPMVWNRPSLRCDLLDIVNSRFDNKISSIAKGAAEFGQKHGGFYATTMEEMNGYWYPWGQNENFIPAWRHIWQIFEDQGANQFATWVWEIYCPEQVDPQARNTPSHPESYYPGDKYVDWIGLSAFSRAQDWGGLKSFQSLIEKSYKDMRKNHPDKPIMQAETGKTKMGNQPSWLVDAYRSIKQMPGFKAMIYYDNVTLNVNDDKTLSDDSLKVMKEIFRDPYWIMAKTN